MFPKSPRVASMGIAKRVSSPRRHPLGGTGLNSEVVEGTVSFSIVWFLYQNNALSRFHVSNSPPALSFTAYSRLSLLARQPPALSFTAYFRLSLLARQHKTNLQLVLIRKIFNLILNSKWRRRESRNEVVQPRLR